MNKFFLVVLFIQGMLMAQEAQECVHKGTTKFKGSLEYTERGNEIFYVDHQTGCDTCVFFNRQTQEYTAHVRYFKSHAINHEASKAQTMFNELKKRYEDAQEEELAVSFEYIMTETNE
ncbi:MAG: hypothetical protein AB7R69_05225 [Candidatus Babeliales bacterium]